MNDSLRQYIFDTGANVSTIMRSEARTLGLRIISAGIDVGTSTNRRVVADLGVADRLTIGAMHLLTPVRWENETLLCQLDTGADQTRLYEPFDRRLRARVDRETRPATRTFGGAGGTSEQPARVFPELRLALGDTVITPRQVDVLTQRITPNEDSNYLDCNIGDDVLDAFSELVLNFRDMAFHTAVMVTAVLIGRWRAPGTVRREVIEMR